MHFPEVLESLLDDLREQQPDHIAVTGDLTNVALEHEFVTTARWLERLGNADDVTVIPGNHDVYVRIEPERSWDYWAAYMQPDDRSEPGRSAAAPTPDDYPVVRERGDVALVGLCSARPTPWFRASGWLGDDQLARTEHVLRRLGKAGRCRVVCVHHPPSDAEISPRRRMSDAAALRAVIERAGAELVLHGHRHRNVVHHIPGPGGKSVPVVGVPSASDIGEKEDKRAQYHLYRIERVNGDFQIEAHVRGYDRASGRFVDEGVRPLD